MKATAAPAALRVWGWPALLTGLTVFGLLSALLGTGLWHWAEWAALAVPVLVCGRHLLPACGKPDAQAPPSER